jgi:hypothetical protein
MPDNRRVPSPAPPDEPEGRPPAEDGARRQVRITSREALLRVVPILFGFRPEASAVILGTQPPRGTLKISLRYSLEDLAAPDVAAYNIGHALNVLTSKGSGLATVIGYGPDAQVAPFIELFREQAGKHNVQLPELLRFESNRYWSYACADPACCPPEGTLFDPVPDPALTGPLAEGVPGVLANREALAGLVASVEGAAAQSMLLATRRAEASIRVVERAHRPAGHSASRHPVVSEGIKAVQEAITGYRQDGCAVPHDEAGWLLAALRDRRVRDDAWTRMEADHRQAHLRLWLDLTRLARPGSVAAPASLLAFVAWQSSNGALANVALDRALADDPDYEMAHILRRILDCGMDPSKAKPPMTPEQVAESYSNSGSARAEQVS